MKKLIITGMLLAAGWSSLVRAGTVAQAPLFLEQSAEPNIMFLIDSSGSMNNIVPDAPYDPSVTYGCPSGKILDASHQVDIRVDSSGRPYFSYNSADYDWGTGSSGLTGKSNVGCFDPALSYTARLYAGSGSAPYEPSSYLAAEYKGNYLNWYFGTALDGTTYGTQAVDWGTGTIRKRPGTERRLDIAIATATSLVDGLNGMRVGLATYNGSVGATIRQGVKPLTATHRANLKTAIAAITGSGSTPLAESLHQIGRYFVGQGGTTSPGSSPSLSCEVNGQYDGALTLHPNGTSSTLDDDALFNASPAYSAGVSNESPICFFCQKNFVIILTDGRPQSDQDITVSELQDYDGDCVSASPACLTHDRKQGRTYESAGSDYLDDVALALYEMDLRPDIDAPDGSEVVNNIVTYTIGFADDQVINDPLMQDTAANGGGQFLMAANAAQLATAFRTAIVDIIGRLASATAVATSSTKLQTDTLMFQAMFNSTDWSGKLLARPITSVAAVSSTPVWDAAASTSIPSHGSRKIYSWNASASAGFSFDVANKAAINARMSALSAAALSDDQINYLRGDTSNEQPAGSFRIRSALLGDIVNSDPLFVGKVNYGYARLPDPAGAAYEAFRKSATYTNRPDMVYIGANDGMLHGFSISYDATNGTASGVEKLAYIPAGVYANLGSLTDPGYSHKFFVDGSPVAQDAYIDPSLNGGSSKQWRTLVAGTTAAGGSSVFVLDVTDPDNFAAGNVLWEVDATTSGFGDLGYTFGQPAIGRMQDGNFYLVFGNGYNSASGKALIYLVQVDKPSNVIVLDTGTTGNGMSTPMLLDKDGDRIVDFVYAGDLKGNVWKANVESAITGNWELVDHDATTSGIQPLFVATDASGTIQPITSKIAPYRNAAGEIVLLFGTGQYFEAGDNAIPAYKNSFYGIIDRGAAVSRAGLLVQEITEEFAAFGRNIRISTKNSLVPATHAGWVMDLVSPVNGAEGERVIDPAIVRDNRVIFTSIIPDNVPCGAGGKSWLMEVRADSGARLDKTPFDLNGDGLFNSDDFVTDKNGVKVPVSGIQDEKLGVVGGVAVIETGSSEVKILSGTTGEIVTVRESRDGEWKRQSWQQLK